MPKRERYTHEVTLFMAYGTITFPICASYCGAGDSEDGIVSMLEENFPKATSINVMEIEDE